VLKVAIVDDEPLARSRLRSLLLDDTAGTLEVIGEAGSGTEALALLEANPADVVLMDIRMPGMDGLEAARHLAGLPAAPAVIFTTAYDEHALAAFDAGGIDYLLKPVRGERLKAALARASQWTSARAAVAATANPRRARTHLSAVVGGNLRLVPLTEVRYLHADGGYVSVMHTAGELLVEDSLRALEEEFGETFLRIHRNTLVATAQVTGIFRDTLGNTEVSLRDVPARLPVSRRLATEVRRRLR
jgi:two-component system response regulator AlgR